jgi:hypothetical protein
LFKGKFGMAEGVEDLTSVDLSMGSGDQFDYKQRWVSPGIIKIASSPEIRLVFRASRFLVEFRA